MPAPKYKNILVAVDGSGSAEDAFRRAVNIAKGSGGRLVIAHIVDTRAFQSFTSPQTETRSQEFSSKESSLAYEDSKKRLADYETFAKEQGLENVEAVVEYGSPRTQISTALPQAFDIDLIVLGATGTNAVERLLMGSVSEYIVHHADCDVLVVRE